jgi:hypothetical protein
MQCRHKSGLHICQNCWVTKQAITGNFTLRCAHETALPKECPRCHAAGWWGHLITQDGSKRNKISAHQGLDPVETQPENLSQRKGLKTPNSNRDKLTPPEAQKNKPGPKPLPLSEDLINQLASQGLGSRVIAKKLTEHGINTSYKTVQRVLSGQRQSSLFSAVCIKYRS